MKEKEFKLCSKSHKLGKLKYSLIMLLICIVIGNITEQIVNIITNHMIILTFKEIFLPTVFWTVFGIISNCCIADIYPYIYSVSY